MKSSKVTKVSPHTHWVEANDLFLYSNTLLTPICLPQLNLLRFLGQIYLSFTTRDNTKPSVKLNNYPHIGQFGKFQISVILRKKNHKSRVCSVNFDLKASILCRLNKRLSRQNVPLKIGNVFEKKKQPRLQILCHIVESREKKFVSRYDTAVDL